jgi:hypothetical protein
MICGFSEFESATKVITVLVLKYEKGEFLDIESVQEIEHLKIVLAKDPHFNEAIPLNEI